MGSDAALLAGTAGEYDKDDREADDIYATIDEFMDGRRRVCPVLNPSSISGQFICCTLLQYLQK